MRGLAIAGLLWLAACERLTVGEADGGGRAGGAGGGAGVGGGTAGGGGGVGGSADGGCLPCLPTTCEWNGCGALCRKDGGEPTCAGGLCLLPKPSAGDVVDVFGHGPDDVWVAEQNGVAHHWNGNAWGCLTTGVSSVLDLWATRDEVWLVGTDTANNPARPMAHFRWDAGVRRLSGADVGVSDQTLYSVWGDDAGTVWASGTGRVLTSSGGALGSEPLPGGRPTFSLAGQTRPGGVELIGGSTAGDLFRRSPDGGWRQEGTSSNETIRGALLLADGGGFAVDSRARFLVRGSGTWPIEADFMEEAHAMGGAEHEPYAVGRTNGSSTGIFWRRDPTLGWQEVFRYPSVLQDVWVAPNGVAFLVANRGVVLRYQAPDCPVPSLPLADEFNGHRLAAGWTPGLGTFTVDGGVLAITAPLDAGLGANLVARLPAGGFRETSVAVEVVRQARLSDGGATGIGTLLFASAPPNTLKIELSGGNMFAYLGDPFSPDASVPQPAGGLRFVRIREAAGTVHFEHTDDPQGRIGYQPFDTGESPTWLGTVESVTLGVYSRTGGPSEPAVFDNLNRCPR